MNVYAYPVLLKDKTAEIGVFAKTNILPGRQLLMNYGKDYWTAKSFRPKGIAADTYRIEDQSLRVIKKQ